MTKVSATAAAVTVAFKLCLLNPLAVLGFESDEHRWMSNAALCLTYVNLRERLKAKSNKKVRQAAGALFSFLPKNKQDALGAVDWGDKKTGPQCQEAATHVTYGEIVSYADYAPSPILLLNTSKDYNCRIDDREVRKRVGEWLTGMGETIHNPHHFRNRGISEYYVWHENAVLRAKTAELLNGDKNVAPNYLWDALVYNAYADHFLQDYFAPGHMHHEDYNKTHMEVLRLHDKDNRRGRWFRLHDWSTLKRRVMAGIRSNDEAVGICFAPSDATSYQELDTMVEVREVLADTRNVFAIKAYGDDQVYRHFQDKGDKLIKKRQAVLLVLVIAQSILDVVEVYMESDSIVVLSNKRCEEPDGNSGFEERGWETGSCYSVGGKDDEYFATNQIGYYPKQQKECGDVRGDTRDARSDICYVEAGGKVTIPQLRQVTKKERVVELVENIWPPVFGFSAGLQRLNEGSRKVYSSELLFTIPTEFENYSWEVSPGYSYVRGNSYDGHGPDLHFYWRPKKLYMFVAMDVGYRFYDGQGLSFGRPRIGGRVGFGNGIPWVYVGMSTDTSIDSGQIRRDSTTFDLGFTLMGPFSLVARGMRELEKALHESDEEVTDDEKP